MTCPAAIIRRYETREITNGQQTLGVSLPWGIAGAR
jgi:hypothetical protein